MKPLFRLLLLSIVFSLTLTTTAQDNPNLASLPGQISIVGIDYNIYAHEFASSTQTQITFDASDTRHYQWPTWSQDGRLAYFCCDLAYATEFESTVFISPDAKSAGNQVYQSRTESVIYAYWSPNQCEGQNCLDLALLMNDVFSGGLSVELIRNEAPTTTNDKIALGGPFYYSWSPTGEQMAFHRNNRRLEIYDVETEEITTTLEQASSGLFQAPAWSPVDDRILVATRSQLDNASNLVIYNDGVLQTLVTDVLGLISFNWSPDGRYVAYRVVGQQGIGAVFVIDAATGNLVSRSALNNVIAFFWAPDSSRLAYLTTGETAGDFSTQAAPSRQFAAYQGGPLQLIWSTLEIETGLNRSYSPFIPTPELGYLLTYFDQFAQSHQIWSPDSTHIVYPVFNRASNQSEVHVLDVTQRDTIASVVAEGRFAVWSFN